MATKTFKIGEYAKGGVITAIADKTKVTIIAKDWDTSKGYNKGSNQSGAKEWDRLEVNLGHGDVYWKLYNYLSDLTTHYYATTIIDWIETKTNITLKNLW